MPNFVVNSGKQFVSNVENNLDVITHRSTLKWALVDVKNLKMGNVVIKLLIIPN